MLLPAFPMIYKHHLQGNINTQHRLQQFPVVQHSYYRRSALGHSSLHSSATAKTILSCICLPAHALKPSFEAPLRVRSSSGIRQLAQSKDLFGCGSPCMESSPQEAWLAFILLLFCQRFICPGPVKHQPCWFYSMVLFLCCFNPVVLSFQFYWINLLLLIIQNCMVIGLRSIFRFKVNSLNRDFESRCLFQLHCLQFSDYKLILYILI